MTEPQKKAKMNYQVEMERVIRSEQRAGRTPKLMLHACCAPCSSACLERLTDDFDVTVFFYNPNITERAEYGKRVKEEGRLIAELPAKHPVHFVEGPYDPEHFYEIARGLEQVPEGGERCRRCFELRLSESVKAAERLAMDYVTTSLTISPLKNAQRLNEIGSELCAGSPVNWLYSDFKKKNGYRRSVELSAEYGLYRQDYCGCIFSKVQRDLEKKKKAAEEREAGTAKE